MTQSATPQRCCLDMDTQVALNNVLPPVVRNFGSGEVEACDPPKIKLRIPAFAMNIAGTLDWKFDHPIRFCPWCGKKLADNES